MTKAETIKAEKMLSKLAERVETCRHDDYGWCLTAHWFGGGQETLVSMNEVRRAVARQSR